MKKQSLLVFIFLINILYCCKNNQGNDIVNRTVDQKMTIPDKNQVDNQEKIPVEVEEIVEVNSNLVSLPFDFEEKNKLASVDQKKYIQLYPQLIEDKLIEIKKIISNNTEDNPDEIFQIDNGGLGFESYIYCTYGDSDSQTLVSVKNNKIISSESIGYAMPENETYQSFVINKDLSVDIYDIEYNSKSKKILEKHQIKKDGSIFKVK